MGNPASQITRKYSMPAFFIRRQNCLLVTAPASPFRAPLTGAWPSMAVWQGWAGPYCFAIALHSRCSRPALWLLWVAAYKGRVSDLRTFSWRSCMQLDKRGFQWVEVTKLRHCNYNPHTSVKSATNSKHGRKWWEEKNESHFSTEFSPIYFSGHKIYILLYRQTQLAEGWISSVSDLMLLALHL